MKANVSWKGKLSFDGTADTGFTLPLGTEIELGGDEDGFKPMELIALGLAGCAGMDVISILSKKRQDVTAFDVAVLARRSKEHPKVFTHIVLEFLVAGHQVEEAALVRAIELSSTRYCPAQAMLGKVVPIELKYSIFEEQLGAERSLVASGEYVVPQPANP